jgi:ABC-2 type transport system ATP-binding protein
VRILGEDMLRHRYRVLPRINFSSPYADLPHRLTVRQNLKSTPGSTACAQPARAHRALAARSADHRAPRPAGRQIVVRAEDPGRIREGAAQRARAAAARRADRFARPDTGDWVRSYLEDYRARTGATILLASHNMAEVERLCAQVMMMKSGLIVDRGSPAELIDRYGRTNLEEVFLHIARERADAVPEPVS